MIVRLFCFFFQAEDGIRDGHVTGVQTCALPILLFDNQGNAGIPPVKSDFFSSSRVLEINPTTKQIVWQYNAIRSRRAQIGRASCRERVEITGGAVATRRKSEENV